MKNPFLIKLIAIIVIIASGVGLLPKFFGLAGHVVLDQLDKIPVASVAGPGISAKVVRVVDGDTVEVVFTDIPGDKEMLRLIGVDRP